MALNDVNVDVTCTCGDALRVMRSYPSEVRGENRWGDAKLLEERRVRRAGVRVALRRGAQTALSMLVWQWLQMAAAVLDMRTIVECSPQLGHTEVSS